MLNANLVACELSAMLPLGETPADTEGYEGFQHLTEIMGTVELTTMHYILRDHDRQKFEMRKRRMEDIAAELNEKYGAGTVELQLVDSYFNMLEVLKDHMHIVRRAEDAYRAAGVKPFHEPIRGGTDGSRLSFMGLPCPNLATGGMNFHSRHELIAVEDMDKMVNTLVELVRAR
jgi:tripeptide aminopeptidase